MGFPGGASGKEPACQCKRQKRCGLDPWFWENPLEEVMATHSSIIAWRISTEGEAWKATIQRAAKSQTQLKRLSMHTHDYIYIYKYR